MHTFLLESKLSNTLSISHINRWSKGVKATNKHCERHIKWVLIGCSEATISTISDNLIWVKYTMKILKCGKLTEERIIDRIPVHGGAARFNKGGIGLANSGSIWRATIRDAFYPFSWTARLTPARDSPQFTLSLQPLHRCLWRSALHRLQKSHFQCRFQRRFGRSNSISTHPNDLLTCQSIFRARFYAWTICDLLWTRPVLTTLRFRLVWYFGAPLRAEVLIKSSTGVSENLCSCVVQRL